MTPEHAVAFLTFALVAAGTPGPSNALLAATGAGVGARRGLPCLLGVVVGMASMMFAVALGLGGLLVHQVVFLRALRWVGTALLLWLAWRIATSGRPGVGGAGRPVGFLGAATFQWVNPKSWLVCASAGATFLDASRGVLGQAVALGLLFSVASLPCGVLWLVSGAAVRRLLSSERAGRAFNRAMALLLAGSVALVIWPGS
ncbi:MAG TPA: LysE family translocator [Candidatus Dormibacteraeota bacterium]|jgi:threonine/homoserine/homoserine lactone efflux protein|nr:LysE family translocator [Candidatus Dormibacteraeota bacterium]